MNAFANVPARFAAMFLAIAFVCGASGVASAAAPVPAALANAIVRDADVAPCFGAQHGATPAAYVAKSFSLSNVTLKSGQAMVVVQGGDSCVCGNANCKFAIYHHDGDTFVPVLSDYAIRNTVLPDGTAVLDSHDSAATSIHVSYRWNGTKYAVTNTQFMLEDPKTLKPLQQTVKFAPGASSAVLTGKLVQAGYDDDYVFDAATGQTITLTLTAHDKHFGSFAITNPAGAQVRSAQSGSLSYTLPKAGTYHVIVDGLDGTFTRYSLEFAIH